MKKRQKVSIAARKITFTFTNSSNFLISSLVLPKFMASKIPNLAVCRLDKYVEYYLFKNGRVILLKY